MFIDVFSLDLLLIFPIGGVISVIGAAVKLSASKLPHPLPGWLRPFQLCRIKGWKESGGTSLILVA